MMKALARAGVAAGVGGSLDTEPETVDAHRVAQVLEDMGTILEIQGENPFRCRAYHNAAQAVRSLPDDLAEMLADGRLAKVPGIGATMLDKIGRLVTQGRLREFDDLKRQTPSGLITLLRVPGLGPKKVQALHKALGVATLADLKAAAESGRIAGLKGFGEKTAEKIREGIAFVESTGERMLQSTAWRLALPLLEALRGMKGVERADVGGSLRRRADTIGDLDLVFAARDPEPVLVAMSRLPSVESVLGLGGTKLSVRLSEQVQCDLRGVLPEQYAFALNYFTGSKAHNIALRRRAQARGLKLSEYALEGESGPVVCADETALYRALGLEYVPPELREDMGEIEAAETGRLPKLIESGDLTGTFHCHTNWSDGANSLEEMAEAARAAGLTYLGIADHSRSAAYAGGLSLERVRAQWSEIDALNKRLGKGFRVFKGIECDILPDGSMDYPDDVLAGFDYVVASVHSSFRQPRAQMTARICAAAAHPSVTMLGHPSGRLLLARAAYEVDLDAVIDACAEHGTMIEINADPHRLDLDSVHCRRARDRGVRLVINPDGHEVGAFALLDYGIAVARRGWLMRKDIWNTRPLSEVNKLLSGHKTSHRT